VQQYEIPLIIVLGRFGANAEADTTTDVRQAAHTIRTDAPGRGDVRASADRLSDSDAALGARVAAGRLTIVGAYCDERNGQVSLAPDRSSGDAAPKGQALEQVVELPRE
jgi:hypothetical protein